MLAVILKKINPFAKPTESEIVQYEMAAHLATIEEADSMIRAQAFVRHMAEANIKAMIEWRDSIGKDYK